jgi:hypothetical protein
LIHCKNFSKCHKTIIKKWQVGIIFWEM